MFGVTIEEDYCAVINLLLLRGRKKSFLQVVCIMYDVPGGRGGGSGAEVSSQTLGFLNSGIIFRGNSKIFGDTHKNVQFENLLY